MTKSNRRKRKALLAAQHQERMSRVGTEHVTPVGGNIFLDLGFPPEEAALLLAEADAKIDAERAANARSRSVELLDVVSLPDGRRGTVVELLNAENALVEIAGTDGATQELIVIGVGVGGLEVVAKVSSSVKTLRRADSVSANSGGGVEAVLSVIAKRKIGELSVEEILEIARKAWPRAGEARKAVTRVEILPTDDYTYDEAEDTLSFVVSTKPIVSDVSYGWNMNVGYSADGEVVEITFLNASTSWKS